MTRLLCLIVLYIPALACLALAYHDVGSGAPWLAAAMVFAIVAEVSAWFAKTSPAPRPTDRATALRSSLIAFLGERLRRSEDGIDADILRAIGVTLDELSATKVRLAAAEKRAAELGVERKRLYQRAVRAEGKR